VWGEEAVSLTPWRRPTRHTEGDALKPLLLEGYTKTHTTNIWGQRKTFPLQLVVRPPALSPSLCPHPEKTLHLRLKYKWRVLHIVCLYTLCKSVGNGRVHTLSRRTLTRPPPCATPARLMATVSAGRGVGKRAGHGGHEGLTVATAGPRRGRLTAVEGQSRAMPK
jgi:hypothetical protein